MEILTAEQVLALAPDAASVKAGQGLANPGKWVTLARDERVVWGECQGSGSLPYRTQVDMQGPAFQCSCPSRKFPCKHGLGLLLLLAGNSGRFSVAPPPAWVTEWLTKRDAQAEKKAARTEAESAPVDPETAVKREASRGKRAANREERVQAGLAELQTWLGDLTRQGLVQARQQRAKFFDHMAARLVDAQAPGVARRVRSFPGLMAGDDWAERLLEEMGSLQCLLDGYARLVELPEPLRATVRQAIGWTVSEQELAGEKAVRDEWLVVGQRVEVEDKLRVQRSWLIAMRSGQAALCLSFAASNQTLEVSLVPGQAVEAEVVYYPSAAPLRAIVRQRHGGPQPGREPTAAGSFEEALGRTAEWLAGNPWLERMPWLVREVVLMPANSGWSLRDAQGATVPMVADAAQAWELYALCGGQPVTIFGEWDGRALRPLNVWIEGRSIPLGGTPE